MNKHYLQIFILIVLSISENIIGQDIDRIPFNKYDIGIKISSRNISLLERPINQEYGYSVGIFYKTPISNFIRFSPEINYSFYSHTSSFEQEYLIESNGRFHYLNISPIIDLFNSSRFNIVFGTYIDVFLLGEIYSHNKNTGNKSIHKINWDKNFNEIGLIYGIKVSIKNIAINIRACRMKYNPVKIRSFGQAFLLHLIDVSKCIIQ